MKVDSPAEQLLFSTVRIEARKGIRIGAGTGFLVAYDWDDKHGVFLVTNKHVIEGYDDAYFFFTMAEGQQPDIGNRFDVQIPDLQTRWTGHPNSDIDVTVMPVSSLLDELAYAGTPPFFRSIPHTLIPDAEQLQELDALEEIVFIGYPNGIYDTVNLLPIIRRGTTATPLQLDYDGMPMFLIDASVFGGSSGSPVFILNTGSYPSRQGLVVGTRVLFLGIVASVAIAPREGTIEFRDIPTGLVPIVKTQDMLDLGLVFKSTTVIETIRECIRRHGADGKQ